MTVKINNIEVNPENIAEIKAALQWQNQQGTRAKVIYLADGKETKAYSFPNWYDKREECTTVNPAGGRAYSEGLSIAVHAVELQQIIIDDIQTGATTFTSRERLVHCHGYNWSLVAEMTDSDVKAEIRMLEEYGIDPNDEIDQLFL